MNKETSRQAYIRLLRSRVDDIDKLPPEQRQHILWADLIAADYLVGSTRRDEHGVPSANNLGPATVKGRLFLQELEAAEKEDSWAGRAIRYSLPVATFLAGILSSVLIDWLKKFLGL